MSYRRPKHISERERAPSLWVDGKSLDNAAWEDCAPVSVLNVVDATTGGDLPDVKTLDEAERLRMAAGYGPLGPTNIQRLAAAAVLRYRIKLPRHVTGGRQIIAALAPGYCAAIAGMMGNFPAGHRLRRWQPGYTGGHSVYLARESTTRRWVWLDPLAPQGAYTGEFVTEDELLTFFRGPIAAAVVVPLAKEA